LGPCGDHADERSAIGDRSGLPIPSQTERFDEFADLLFTRQGSRENRTPFIEKRSGRNGEFGTRTEHARLSEREMTMVLESERTAIRAPVFDLRLIEFTRHPEAPEVAK